MIGPDDADFLDERSGGQGCYECDAGWRHGCCDDLCRNTIEAEGCDSAIPCPLCNPEGEPS